ncbi:hypothetical protein C5167_050814 [Papaver somniferum]|uniref:DNA primase n=1 Tax=Papaver somniferum TaxID=3469 RepID=A0A4Y7KTQ6_PAPSO|nr:hypothetical protein C5167_050814 [Papaver somniferum]
MFIVKHWNNSSVISFGYHSMVEAVSESIGEDSGNTKDYGASQNIMPSLNILNNLACSPTNTSQDRKHPACDLSYFGRREFSFILGNDVYLRYQSFNNAAQMESSIKRECPFEIDISAVYNVDPAKRNAYSGENAFTPMEELVFNIDMSDYDDVQYCCSGANICKKCWPLMTIAIKVIDSALRENFSFTHILWVYNVPRGVHCWVCDARARTLLRSEIFRAKKKKKIGDFMGAFWDKLPMDEAKDVISFDTVMLEIMTWSYNSYCFLLVRSPLSRQFSVSCLSLLAEADLRCYFSPLDLVERGKL